VAEWVYSRSEALDPGQQTAPGASARVAIVGAGPAGLSAAYFLARLGYAVTVFEALSEPGGLLLRTPDAQLPREVLRREIDEILALGVELRLRSPVSDIDELFAEGYQGIFLATGVGEPPRFTFSSEEVDGGDPEPAWVVDPETLETSRPGVFVGGHAAHGPAFLIEAIADGHRAALSIDRHLRGVPLVAPHDHYHQPTAHLTAEDVAELYQSKGVNRRPRKASSAMGSQESAPDSQQGAQGLTEEQAHAEALRCLRCGICSDCGLCVDVCAPNCIDLDMPTESIELNVAAIVVATGFAPLDPSGLTQYGYHRHKNVVTSLEYERLVGASGPTGGQLRRLSDGRPVKRLGFVQCVGSRDINHNRFCSSVCCMFATQEAIVANERDGEMRSTIFYTDLRAGGKGFQECVNQARRHHKVTYLRARVAEIGENTDESPVVWYEDTHSGQMRSETVDLAVLVTGLRPGRDVPELADLLGIEVDEHHFIKTDPFSPTDTSRDGIFACGFCRGPADISESVSQASAAAARAAELVVGG